MRVLVRGKTIVVETESGVVVWRSVNNELRRLAIQRGEVNADTLREALIEAGKHPSTFHSAVNGFRRVIRDAKRILGRDELKHAILDVLPRISDLRSFLAAIALEEPLPREDLVELYERARDIAKQRGIVVETSTPTLRTLMDSPWVFGIVLPGKNVWRVIREHGRRIPLWKLLEAEVQDLRSLDESTEFVRTYILAELAKMLSIPDIS